MRNWLYNKRGVTNLPLYYVINKDNNPLTRDHSGLIIYNDSLTTTISRLTTGRLKIYQHLLFWILMPLNGVIESSTKARGEKDG